MSTYEARQLENIKQNERLVKNLGLKSDPELRPQGDLEALKASWSSWTPSAEPPTRDEEGKYHFNSHPSFTPNKSPEDIIREGSFGGSYWRPLYSRHLRTTISEDWRELPKSWTENLSVERYLTSDTYSPEINKYGVACGQSIEKWEAAGWIAHQYDVRGWFQWYCRFFLGRRCENDERQVNRWRKCVGETDRWRRTLLKKYVQNGIHTVTDEDDEVNEKKDVSPVIHQTCHHWAWEVRQEALDRFWTDGIQQVSTATSSSQLSQFSQPSRSINLNLAIISLQ
ncbi:hypothetical protein GGR58DRAFT_528252 [Xylaria digitata]|nr:hypothetical protein GGR58DRAFT_528252 [Xylaria digitata]